MSTDFFKDFYDFQKRYCSDTRGTDLRYEWLQILNLPLIQNITPG
jgi:hypothetical protein